VPQNFCGQMALLTPDMLNLANLLFTFTYLKMYVNELYLHVSAANLLCLIIAL